MTRTESNAHALAHLYLLGAQFKIDGMKLTEGLAATRLEIDGIEVRILPPENKTTPGIMVTLPTGKKIFFATLTAGHAASLRDQAVAIARQLKKDRDG